MSHSIEPWEYWSGHGIISAINTDGDRKGKTEYIADIVSRDISDAKCDANAARIIACVNACKGISNERLARMDLQAAIECLDNSGGNIDCNDYCGVAQALSRPKEMA